MEFENIEVVEPDPTNCEELFQRRQPVLLRSFILRWPAVKLWKGVYGIRRLNSLAGDSLVQVMKGSSTGTFYGDLLSHQRARCRFGDFLERVREALEPTEGPPEVADYLAQAAIRSSLPPHGDDLLSGLLADIEEPHALQGCGVVSCNLWMNSLPVRSSTHYDPYHNLLCVVAGSKSVRLVSPKHTALLYPKEVYGESTNHSQVDFANPDLERFPLYSEVDGLAVSAELEPGDALFIPEGWWHQVSSAKATIAVNFWWQSRAAAAIGGECNGFFLREALAAAIHAEKERVIRGVVPYPLEESAKRPAPTLLPVSLKKRLRGGSSGGGERESTPSGPQGPMSSSGETEGGPALESSGSQSVGASEVGSSECRGAQPTSPELTTRERHAQQLLAFHVCLTHEAGEETTHAEGDVPARVLASLRPAELRRVLLSMSRKLPRALNVLLTRALSPMAAEMLTQAFEAGAEERQEADGGAGEAGVHPGEGSCEFFAQIYSVVSDQDALMQFLVRQKEAFAAEACRSVLFCQLNLGGMLGQGAPTTVGRAPDPRR